MQMQMALLENQAHQGATLDATSTNVASIQVAQSEQGTVIDNTYREVVSIHTLMEKLHRNLEFIRAKTNGSAHQLSADQLHVAAVTQPLQQEAEPREENSSSPTRCCI